MTCRLCKAEAQVLIREFWFDLSGADIGIRAPLCPACWKAAPEKVRAELSSPMVKSMLLVMGAKIGLRG